MLLIWLWIHRWSAVKKYAKPRALESTLGWCKCVHNRNPKLCLLMILVVNTTDFIKPPWCWEQSHVCPHNFIPEYFQIHKWQIQWVTHLIILVLETGRGQTLDDPAPPRVIAFVLKMDHIEFSILLQLSSVDWNFLHPPRAHCLGAWPHKPI